MSNFPSSLKYTMSGYSYSVEPSVGRSVFVTNNTRQRRQFKKRDDIFNVRILASNADLITFESFVENDINNGQDFFTAPYWDSNEESIGSGRIVDGAYSVSYISPDLWEITYQLEIENRDLSKGQELYVAYVASELYGSIDDYYDIIVATDLAVNDI